jgi:hypothetical protein
MLKIAVLDASYLPDTNFVGLIIINKYSLTVGFQNGKYYRMIRDKVAKICMVVDLIKYIISFKGAWSICLVGYVVKFLSGTCVI